MRKNRPVPSLDTARTDREEAAARRLAILAADLGHDLPRPTTGERAPESPGPRDDASAGEPVRMAPTPWPGAPDPSAPVAADDAAPALPRGGRHADRRRWRLPPLPGIGPTHLAVLAVVVAVALAGTTWWLVRDRAEPVARSTTGASAEPLVEVSSHASSDASAPDTSATVTVDVTGKVRRPGIVVLETGARVVDALEAAGGARKGVRTTGINLARVLADGEQIIVGRDRPPGRASPPQGEDAPVNLNLADAADLEDLPGVGPVTAAAIIEWREQHGGFSSVDQLIDVSGIGEKTLAEIAPHATV